MCFDWPASSRFEALDQNAKLMFVHDNRADEAVNPEVCRPALDLLAGVDNGGLGALEMFPDRRCGASARPAREWTMTCSPVTDPELLGGWEGNLLLEPLEGEPASQNPWMLVNQPTILALFTNRWRNPTEPEKLRNWRALERVMLNEEELHTSRWHHLSSTHLRPPCQSWTPTTLTERESAWKWADQQFKCFSRRHPPGGALLRLEQETRVTTVEAQTWGSWTGHEMWATP